jgi:predicted ATPase/DNA-binding SARP family transcriptional activator
MNDPWAIQLFGGLRTTNGERVFTRFRTQKTAALLAYLAYYQGRSHARETLIDMLWPESEPESGRHNLSLALSSLRSQLEPPGVSDGAVIVADRFSVELNPEAVTTDVNVFEQSVRRALQARNEPDRVELLAEAADAYGGDLLPGFYEDWVLVEQQRLAERYVQTAMQLVGLLVRQGDTDRALAYAQTAARNAPLHEEVQRDLIQLLADRGELDAARRQFREYERLAMEKLGHGPSGPTLQLARQIDAMLSATDYQALPIIEPADAPSLQSSRAPEGLPSGTVTFLFTDVEGSTALWEKAGDAFRRALSLHHALLRREFKRFGGIEVKEAGDSFLAAFVSVSDGLGCAVACQRALASQDWAFPRDEAGKTSDTQQDSSSFSIRVRMALNTGDVECEQGEYHGLVLHRGARLLAAAHGGQVVCSGGTSALVRRDLEQDVRLKDLGLYKLRGVEEPERIFQIEYPGMAAGLLPPLNAEPAHQAHLPLQFTRFFGRERELARLADLLKPDGTETRLVTLTGPGGTGKTRLAIETAGRLAEGYAGAVWFVPLAEVSEPSLLMGTIQDALAIPRDPHHSADQQVATALSRQRSLLILDNLEQLVDTESLTSNGVTESAVDSIQTLIEQVPTLSCLLTSRQLLGLPGEQEFPVPPLSTPSRRGDESSPEGLSAYESVRLFVDRAQAVKPDFRITNQNAPAVAELCDRLEGLPLAIELAAARALVMTPSQMLAQLAHRFEFLVSRKRGISERQRTLRATIDWSYRLLAPDLQRFFARLSIFRGGLTVEAAESVCDEPLSLDFLAQLRESSLVLTEEHVGTMQFRLLEMLREYAADRLAAIGEDEETTLRRRHAEFFLSASESAEPHLTGPEQAEWLERLEADHDNFRAALTWSARAGDDDEAVRIGLRLGSALWRFWSIRGYAREGRRYMEPLLGLASVADDPTDQMIRAVAGSAAGALAHDMGDYAGALALLNENLPFWRETGDPARLAHTLNLVANVLLDQGRDVDAVPLYEEALTLYRDLADRRGTAMVLSNLGALAVVSGQSEQAEVLLEESLALKRTLGSRYSLAIGLENLGNVERSLGNLDRAIELHTEALAIRRELGHRAGIAMSCNNLGQALVLKREQSLFQEAADHLREALGALHELGDGRGLSECLMSCAALAAESGRAGDCARLVGAANALRIDNGITLTAGDEEVNASLRAIVRAAADDGFLAREKAGRQLSVAEVVELALGIMGES